MTSIIVFVLSFFFMEWSAWFMHKFVMHGFLWSLHEDHHRPNKNRWWQRNDAFAIFFAIPSFLCILFGTYWFNYHVAVFGYGIMAYGAAYFFVHEVVIHRRLHFLDLNHWYFKALIRAHRDHHKNRFKEDGENFGMLIVPTDYFRKARQQAY